MSRRGGSEVRVGIFVVIVLALGMGTILVLSSRSSFFRRSFRLTTSFANVAGLSVGSEVRLSGVAVGFVDDIRFPQDPEARGVRVLFAVDRRGMERLTQDAKATIATMGLLGARYIELFPGDPKAGPVREGDAIQGVDPVDYLKELQRAGEIVRDVGDLSRAIQRVVESFSGDGPPTDLSQTVTSIKNIVQSVEKGPGLAHELLVAGKRQAIVDDLAASIRALREIVSDVRDGRGAIHSLVYDERGGQVVGDLRKATDAIQALLVEVRDGNGTLHGLIYGGGAAATNVIADLEATAANLRAITGAIRSGQGTLGAILVDPTIYENVLKITGEVERNKTLKSVIRYVVKQSEAKKK